MKIPVLKTTLKKTFFEWFLALLFSVVLFFLSLWVIVTLYLPYYTRHGKEVEVPYVIGLERDKAAKIVMENGLRYTFLGRGLYVIKTVPGAGTVVKKGRRIKLTLSDRLTER